jgi:homoserine dehydrogenase
MPAKRLIANVEGAMNAVLVQGDAVGATLYYGKGAGAEPTASAVIADLVDITRLPPPIRTPRAAPGLPARRHDDAGAADEEVTSYYLRMRVSDEPACWPRSRASWPSRHQHRRHAAEESREGEPQTDIIILPHLTRESTSMPPFAASKRSRPCCRRSRACAWKN